MREYTKIPQPQTHTLDRNPKVCNQAPTNVILQRYKTRSTQRYATDEDDELLQGKFDTTQREENSSFLTPRSSLEKSSSLNKTGLPDNLKIGIENLSGYSMDDVKVHYNSSKPAQLQALAYTQGTDIHVAPGQEKHLPHEAWHVVQQKQGRVQPTIQLQGVNVNDNESLEREADVMGGKIMQMNNINHVSMNKNLSSSIIQRIVNVGGSPQTLEPCWKQIKNKVIKVYKRKKTLSQKIDDKYNNYDFPDYQTLANQLDFLCQPKLKKGRVRPGWAPGILKHFNDMQNGSLHRRHIIMSSVLRQAVYKVSDENIHNPNLLATYNSLLDSVGLINGYKNIDDAEFAVVYMLHNNPANLVKDSGPENSAIGSLAHTIENILTDKNSLMANFDAFKLNPDSCILSLVQGFRPDTQTKICQYISSILVPAHPEARVSIKGFKEFFELLYDNTAVDLMTNKSLPDWSGSLIQLHLPFINCASKGDLGLFTQTACDYIKIGLSYYPHYNTIWN